MPTYPIGTKWQAGANGDCSQAGNCAHGACGPGENTESDCPEWSHTATYVVEYTPGSGSVRIGGRTFSPGETVGFLRGTLTEPRPYEYPVEVFRAPNAPPPFDPDDASEGIVTFEISGLTGGYASWNAAFYRFAAGEYRRVTGSNYRIIESGGEWFFQYFGIIARITFSGNSLSYDGIDPATGLPYNAAYTPTTGSGTITYYGENQPGTAIPAGMIKIGLASYPPPFPMLGQTNYLDIPEEASALDVTNQWGADTYTDYITLVGNPAGVVKGTITLTIRSACEDPVP